MKVEENGTPEWLSRTELLFGAERLEVLRKSHVLIVGLGGVGAYVAEMLARAGVGEMTIVDGDVVNESNCNRQLVALNSTIGQPKSSVLAARLKDINNAIVLHVHQEFLRDARTIEILEAVTYDYVVDAIDTLSPKVFLLSQAHERGLKVISSMGAGGKVDPSKIKLSDISKSDYCKLARMVRKRLHKLGIRKGITVVYSNEVVPEDAIIITEGEQNKKSNVGTISYMPAMFGCFIASHIIRELTTIESATLK